MIFAGDGAEIIVLSVHWGPNYRWWPPHRYRRFAREAVNLGVDIVHGHSAHVLQAVEFHGNGLILYDTGDYMEDFLRRTGIPQRPLLPVPGRGRAGPDAAAPHGPGQPDARRSERRERPRKRRSSEAT